MAGADAFFGSPAHMRWHVRPAALAGGDALFGCGGLDAAGAAKAAVAADAAGAAGGGGTQVVISLSRKVCGGPFPAVAGTPSWEAA